LRIAYIENFQGYYAANQTIEPTTLMGFSQFYSDPAGTRSKNYSIAIDKALSRFFAYGISYVDRNLELEAVRNGTEIVDTLSTKERIADAYLQYIPNVQVSMSMGLGWDRRSTAEIVSETDSLYVDLYSVPFVVSLFADNGASFTVKQTYFKQRFSSLQSPDRQKQNTWITSVIAGYRFPGHFGSLEFGLDNLFDESDEFVNYDATTLAFYPGRLWFAAININI